VTRTGEWAGAFERCMSVGGVAVFPADTVYGLACDVHNRVAVERLYRFKRRRLDKPSAVMFFDRDLALAALPELGPTTRSALARLLPGAVTVLVPNPERRFPLACGEDLSTFGLRVPVVPGLEGVAWPVLQSSANLAGEPDARVLEQVPESIRRAADLVLDGGERPGTPSTVVDLRRYEDTGEWSIVRPGDVDEAAVAAALGHQFHFEPDRYVADIRAEVPDYDRLHDELIRCSDDGPRPVRRVLDLGTGTGETARRLLEHHPDAFLVGLDESPVMLAAAARQLPADRVRLVVGTLENPLPESGFDLVCSALAVHHLPGESKRDLFGRVRDALEPGGRFVLADVVVPADGADVMAPLTDGYDHPSPVADQLRWLGEVGFDTPQVAWARGDLAVLTATRR
jgi:L-threonylcarbamoyladenylate synthase